MAKTRQDQESEEAVTLAPYALHSIDSRGRRFPETEDPHRPVFARDRDRVVHSGAFRRLEYKTQVVLSGTGDNYRTRLTHTLEVAQIARSLARALGLNETLVEALALAHDLGHPPFAHTGEHVLREIMEPHGGFEHNVQALRIVDLLECPYPGIPGLNLTLEVRESILKHGPDQAGELGREFPRLPQPWLEAQLVDLADSIAYQSHDLEDGLRFGVFKTGDLEPLELWSWAREEARSTYSKAREEELLRPTIHRTLQLPIRDVLEESQQCIENSAIETAAAARQQPQRLIRFSDKMSRMQTQLKQFLFARFYRAERVQQERDQARFILRDLFDHFVARPEHLADWARERLEADATSLQRVVCDYVAGMTDRFAMQEHQLRCAGTSQAPSSEADVR